MFVSILSKRVVLVKIFVAIMRDFDKGEVSLNPTGHEIFSKR